MEESLKSAAAAERGRGLAVRQELARREQEAQLNITDERVAGVERYFATGRQKHGEKVEPANGPPPEDVSGQPRERRGFSRFSFRGVGRVRLEW